MKQPTEVLDIFKEYSEEVEGELVSFLERTETPKMYGMMRYFLGFTDESFTSGQVYGGKRFRSSLCLLIADMYNSRTEALQTAASLELYHNFTLIHDDIVDKDELRRGRPTVWKVWGIDHAINTGDAQLILSVLKILGKSPLSAETQIALMSFLGEQYLAVIEGQHLDFTMSDEPVEGENNTEKVYFEMIAKKTAVLIAAATRSAGIAAGLDVSEQEVLWDYGYNLGLAYQLNDDLVSIWGDPEVTGKAAHNDIKERKKTLPILYVYAQLAGDDKTLFRALYNGEGPLSDSSVHEVVSLLDKHRAYEYVRGFVDEYSQKAKDSVAKLSCGEQGKETLLQIVEALLPDKGKVS